MTTMKRRFAMYLRSIPGYHELNPIDMHQNRPSELRRTLCIDGPRSLTAGGWMIPSEEEKKKKVSVI